MLLPMNKISPSWVCSLGVTITPMPSASCAIEHVREPQLDGCCYMNDHARYDAKLRKTCMEHQIKSKDHGRELQVMLSLAITPSRTDITAVELFLGSTREMGVGALLILAVTDSVLEVGAETSASMLRPEAAAYDVC